MTTIHLISHGNVIIDPKTDPGLWDLNDKGIRQSKKLATFDLWKEVSQIYVSGETKAQETAEIVRDSHVIPLEIDKQLNEFNKDSTGYLPFEEFMVHVDQFFAHPEKSEGGWETLNHTTERLLNFTADTAKKHPRKTIAFIGHGVALGMIVCKLKGIKKPSHDDIQKEIGSIATIDWDKQKVLSEWNVY